MICPRCSVGEVSDVTHECALCGFSPTGAVALQTPYESAIETQTRDVLGRQFQIEGLLGHGAASVVFLALETERDRLVALKVIPRSATMSVHAAAAFQREAQLAATLDHPHIVPVYAFGVSPPLLWYTMEYCSSRTVADQITDGGTGQLDLAACVRIVQQVASALDHAHRRGLIHGDVRPSNVLVDTNGWARLSDFGILKALAPFAAQGDDAWISGLRYRAPEWFARHNQVGPSADQYALAVLTLECLGAFSAGTAVPRHSVPTPPPDLSAARPDLPFHVADAVRRATAVKPTDRFASVLDFAAALTRDAQLVAPTAVMPRPAPGREMPALPRGRASVQRTFVAPEESPRPAAPARSRRWVLPTLVGAAVLLTAAAAWYVGLIAPAPSAAPRSDATAELDPLGFATYTAPPVDSAAPAPSPVATAPAPPPGTTDDRTRTTPASPPQVAGARPLPRRPGRPPAAQPRVLAPGKIYVSSTPWGELSIDGQLIGNTPKADVQLPAGSHRIRITRDGFMPFERAIRIRPGEVLRLTDIVLQELRP
jgi:hypothetical protein